MGLSQIARSDNGGLTFGVAIPMWMLVQCGGLHGHIKVAPDGTVYVPNKSCGGQQGVAVSEDNGLTWSIRTVPGSTPGDTDPSVGVGADSTVYFAYADGDGRSRVAVSHDRGLTWVNVTDVGATHGIKNAVFPAAVAGDANRAAVFFLGSTTEGANGRGTDLTFDGTWFGYVATTYDGGQTWVTVNATPNDPVQRGVVCTAGTTCPGSTRNLLDFNDVTIDKRGRQLAAFADGCVTAACIGGADKNGDGRIDGNDNDGTARATIIRQSGGRTLFSAFELKRPGLFCVRWLCEGERAASEPCLRAHRNPGLSSASALSGGRRSDRRAGGRLQKNRSPARVMCVVSLREHV